MQWGLNRDRLTGLLKNYWDQFIDAFIDAGLLNSDEITDAFFETRRPSSTRT